MGDLELRGGNQPWSEANQQAYIDAANKWLSVLTAVDDKAEHTIKMQISVEPLEDGNGEAGPDSEEEVGEFLIPTEGRMTIGAHTYAAGFDQVEFNANILHEMGHIIGLGTLTEDFITNDAAYKGNVFRAPNSQAVLHYQQIYGVNYDFVPFDDEGGHLYDSDLQGDKRRVLDNSEEIPPLTKEVVANVTVLSSVGLGVLDDIGYEVDYSQAEQYTP